MIADQAQTWPKHDCYAWNVRHYHSQPDARYQSCGVCGRILVFRFRSFWQQLHVLFWNADKTWKETKVRGELR